MKFDKFLQIAYSCLSEGKTEGKFVQNLLMNFVDDKAPDNKPPYSLDESTYRAYFAGTRIGSRTARWILGYADLEKFQEYLESFSFDALRVTASSLAQLNCEAEPKDCCGYISEQLVEALDLASQTRPGRKAKVNSETIFVDNELRNLLSALTQPLDTHALVKLNYEAVRVKEKIKLFEPSNNDLLLVESIENHVVKYYKVIENFLRLRDVEHPNSSQQLLNMVRRRYLALSIKKTKASIVYYGIRNWIMDEAKSDNELAAEILTSFFIQNCEVFDASSK